MITTTQMEYVLAVAKEGNFRKAAKRCFVTQPTLSVQVQKFEDSINAVVFDRSRNPVVPTKVGSEVIEQVQIAYTELQRIFEVADADRGKVEGQLKVGVIPTVAPYLIPRFLGSLSKMYPNLELAILEMTTANCLKALDQEEIDVAILATEEGGKKYFQDLLYDEDLLLYVHKDHPFATKKKVTADDLEYKDFWLLEEGHCLKDEVVKLCKLGKEPRKKRQNLNLKVGSLEALRYLVEENFGYTLLPYLSTLRLSKSKNAVLKTLQGKVPKRTIYLTRRRSALKLAAINALKEEICKTV